MKAQGKAQFCNPLSLNGGVKVNLDKKIICFFEEVQLNIFFFTLLRDLKCQHTISYYLTIVCNQRYCFFVDFQVRTTKQIFPAFLLFGNLSGFHKAACIEISSHDIPFTRDIIRNRFDHLGGHQNVVYACIFTKIIGILYKERLKDVCEYHKKNCGVNLQLKRGAQRFRE